MNPVIKELKENHDFSVERSAETLFNSQGAGKGAFPKGALLFYFNSRGNKRIHVKNLGFESKERENPGRHRITARSLPFFCSTVSVRYGRNPSVLNPAPGDFADRFDPQ